MRKIFLALAAVVVTLVIVAPHIASAADIRMTGIFRWRGVTGDDLDRNSRTSDTLQFMDSLMRVRWTAPALTETSGSARQRVDSVWVSTAGSWMPPFRAPRSASV